MNIRETRVTSGIVESLELPPQVFTPYPEEYFKLPTTIAAVGPRGKGKTTALMRFNFTMFQNGYFTRIYIISPTFASNDTLRVVPIRPGDVYTNTDTAAQDLEDILSKCIDEVRFYEEIGTKYTTLYKEYLKKKKDVSKMEKEDVRYLREMQIRIEQMYEEYERMNEEMDVKSKQITDTLKDKPTRIPNTVFVSFYDGVPRRDVTHPWFYPPPTLTRPVPVILLDDVSHSAVFERTRRNPLTKTLLLHRHIGGQGYGVTFEFGVQAFTSSLPKAIRQNTMQFLLFKTNDMSQLDTIYQQVCGYTTKDVFLKMFEYATKEPNGFLVVDTETTDINRVFRKGFDIFLSVENFVDNVPEVRKNFNIKYVDPITKVNYLNERKRIKDMKNEMKKKTKNILFKTKKRKAHFLEE